MGEHGESIGVVSGAYFVGRAQLLQWINDLTSLNYAKIEDTASGVFACHVFDALYPGSIRMERVKFDARHSYDYVNNYKLLQECFNRNKLKRQIDIQKLIRGKYQDNLEFMQWLKAYYDQHATEDALHYDGRARREQLAAQTPTSGTAAATSAITTAPSRTVSNARATPGPGRPKASTTSTRAARTRGPPTSSGTASMSTASTLSPVSRARPGAGAGASAAQLRQLRETVESLREENAKLEESVANAEGERDFYFNKLRQVEIVVQAVEVELEQPDVDPLEPLRHALDDIRHHLYTEEEDAGAIVEDGPVAEGEEAPYPEEEELQHDPEFEASATAT